MPTICEAKWLFTLLSVAVALHNLQPLPDIYLSEGEAAVIDISPMFAGTFLNYSVQNDPQHRASVLSDLSLTQLLSLSTETMNLGPVFDTLSGFFLLYSNSRLELWSERGGRTWEIDFGEQIQGVSSMPETSERTAVCWTTPKPGKPGELFLLEITTVPPIPQRISGVTTSQSSLVITCTQGAKLYIIEGSIGHYNITRYIVSLETHSATRDVSGSFEYEGEILDATCIHSLTFLTPEGLLSTYTFSVIVPTVLGRLLQIRSFSKLQESWCILSERGMFSMSRNELLAVLPEARFEVYTGYLNFASAYIIEHENELYVAFWVNTEATISCVFRVNFPFSAEELIDVKALTVAAEFSESTFLVNTKKGVFLYKMRVSSPSILVHAGSHDPYTFQLCASEFLDSKQSLCTAVTIYTTNARIVVVSSALHLHCYLKAPEQECSYQVPSLALGSSGSVESSNPEVSFTSHAYVVVEEYHAEGIEQLLCFDDETTMFLAKSARAEVVLYLGPSKDVYLPLRLSGEVLSCAFWHQDLFILTTDGGYFHVLTNSGNMKMLPVDSKSRMKKNNNSLFFFANFTLYEWNSSGLHLALNSSCEIIDVCIHNRALSLLCAGYIEVYIAGFHDYRYSTSIQIPTNVVSMATYSHQLITLSTDNEVSFYYWGSSVILLYSTEVESGCSLATTAELVVLQCGLRMQVIDVTCTRLSAVVSHQLMASGELLESSNQISSLQIDGAALKKQTLSFDHLNSRYFYLNFRSKNVPIESEIITSQLTMKSWKNDSVSVSLTVSIENAGAFLTILQSEVTLSVPWKESSELALWGVAAGHSLQFSLRSESAISDISVESACVPLYKFANHCNIRVTLRLFMDTLVLTCMQTDYLEVIQLQCGESQCVVLAKDTLYSHEIGLSFILEYEVLIVEGSRMIIAVDGFISHIFQVRTKVIVCFYIKQRSLEVIYSADYTESNKIKHVVKETESLYHYFSGKSLRHFAITLRDGSPPSVHEEVYSESRLISVKSVSSERQGQVLTLYVLTRTRELLTYSLQGRLSLSSVSPLPPSLQDAYSLCRAQMIFTNSTALYFFSVPDFHLLGVSYPPMKALIASLDPSLDSVNEECTRLALSSATDKHFIVDRTAPSKSTVLCSLESKKVVMTNEGYYSISITSIEVFATPSPRLRIHRKLNESTDSVRTMKLVVSNLFGEVGEVTVTLVRKADNSFALWWALGAAALSGLGLYLVYAARQGRKRNSQFEIELESTSLSTDDFKPKT